MTSDEPALREGSDWQRYGRALHRAMAEVLNEFPEDVRPHALEVADYWISVGLTIALERRTRVASSWN
jgi:hypothetical protein